MSTKLRFPEGRFVQPQAQPEWVDSPVNVGDKFRSAIAAPINFPPLKDVVFEGDTVAIAVLSELNNPATSLNGLLESFVEEDLAAKKLSVVSSFPIDDLDSDSRQAWVERFSESEVELTFFVHDSDDQNDVAFMAASFAGDPIYVNRCLFDADMIVPLTSPSNANPDFERLLYPEFSTAETKARFQDTQSNQEVLRSEIRHANELVGASFVVSSIPGVGGSVNKVVAGEPQAVYKHDRESNEHWNLNRVSDGKVVVATIEADTGRQNWNQFFQALSAAAMAADNTEQIIICSEIDVSPEGFHQQVLQLPFETDYEKINQIQRTLPADLQHIPGILEEMSVFLKSNLNAAEAEELGFGHIENEDQIQRIVDNAESGIYLRDAHLCKISE